MVEAEVQSTRGTLLEVRGLVKMFGGLPAVSGLDLDVRDSSIHALIGPNGAGKTTTFNMISRLETPTRGTISFDGVDLLRQPPHFLPKIGIGRTFQTPQLFGSLSVHENVMVGRHGLTRVSWFAVGLHVRAAIEEEADLRSRAEMLVEFVGLQDDLHRRAAELPLGKLRLLEVARALACEPRLLLLDEPASGLTPMEVDHLTRTMMDVCERGTAVLLVEHNVSLVMGVAKHVVVLNYGKKIAEGSPADIRRDPRVIEAYLGHGRRGARARG